MLEAIVEGGGVLAGLGLLLYFQVLRPDAKAVSTRVAAPTLVEKSEHDRDEKQE